MKITGKQLTAMVVAGCAAVVLMPVGVNAAVSSFSIADPTHTGSGRKATVSGGALRVAGTVNTQPSTAWSISSRMYDEGLSNGSILKEIPAGGTLRVGTFSGAMNSGPGGLKITLITRTQNTPGDCASGGFVIDYLAVLRIPAGDTRSLNYSPMMQVKNTSGSAICLVAYPEAVAGANNALVTLTGA